MALEPQDVELIYAMISNALNKALQGLVQASGAKEGVATSASWDPVGATHAFTMGHTAAFFDDDDGQPINRPNVSQLTVAPGLQYGVKGGERTVAMRTVHGYRSLFIAGEDDSPNTPAGELHMLHASAQNEPDANPIVYDSGVKLTNDGPTPGDQLGGTMTGLGGALTVSTAVGPTGTFTITTDAIAQTHTIETPGGLMMQANDIEQTISHVATSTTKMLLCAATNEASILGGKVGVGALASDLSLATNAAARLTDVETAITNLRQSIGNVAQQMAQAAVAAGVNNAEAWLGEIQGGLPSLSFVNILSSVAHVTVPTCSASVLIE